MNHFRDQKGIGLIFEIVVTAIVLVAIGFAVFSYIKTKAVSNRAASTPTPTTTPQPTTQGLVKTKVLAEGLMASIPAGWERLRRTIGDQAYQINFQLETVDFLTTGQYSSNNVVIEKTKLKSGQEAYILKNFDSALTLSACPLRDGMGCSFKYQEKYLIVSLNGAYQPGDQAVRNIDFKSQYTAEAVKDFKTMVEALEL